MDSLKNLLEKNRNWAERSRQSYPDFFEKLAGLQTPRHLRIGWRDRPSTPDTST